MTNNAHTQELITMRWPNTDPPGVQPYNDVRSELESILEKVVVLGDKLGASGVDLLKETSHVLGGSSTDVPTEHVLALLDILRPHTTSELDLEDLTYELLELIGDDPSDDMHND